MDSKITNTTTQTPTQAVTTADGLTVNSVIVPVLKTVTYSPLAVDVSKAILITTEAVQITAVRVVFGIASVSGTLNIEKLTGTTAPGSGTALLTGTISLAGTANTVLSGTLTSTTADLQFAAGNRLGIVLAGTLTSLIGALVVVDYKRI